MTRKRFSEEAALDLLRQIDLDLASGSTVETAIRTAGIKPLQIYPAVLGKTVTMNAAMERSGAKS